MICQKKLSQVKHLCTLYALSNERTAVIRAFLLELYVLHPNVVLSAVGDDLELTTWLCTHLARAHEPDHVHTELDATIHRLLTEMFALADNRDHETRVILLCMMLRRIAGTHRSIFIRHLSLMAALAQPVFTQPKSVYNQGNHMLLLHQCLLMLKDCGSQLFARESITHANAMLDCMMIVVKERGLRSPWNFFDRVDQVMQLLCDYERCSSASAYAFIGKHWLLMHAIAYHTYSRLPHAVQLLARTPPPPTNVQVPPNATALAEALGLDTLPSGANANSTRSPPNMQMIRPYLHRLSHTGNAEEMRQTIQDMRAHVEAKPNIAPLLVPQLTSLMTSSTYASDVRQSAENMCKVLLILLDECPNFGDKLAPVIVECLSSGDQSALADQLIQNVAVIAASARAHSTDILRSALQYVVNRRSDDDTQDRLAAAVQVIYENGLAAC